MCRGLGCACGLAGYSWKTNQYGLAIDNLCGYELVLPNGTVASVTGTTFPDLFWGLKVCLHLYNPLLKEGN